MSIELVLPRLVGTREAASRLLDELDVPLNLSNDAVWILGRALSTSTTSFADELVKLLSERHATEIVLVGTPSDFDDAVLLSAARRHYKGVRRSSISELVAS